jgi:hypothetical protein
MIINFSLFESVIDLVRRIPLYSSSKSKGGERWFYHATRLRHLSAIRKNGLLPNDDRPTNWKTFPEAGWSRGKVFVTDNFLMADDYGYEINNCWKKVKPFPILRIKLDSSKLEKDEDLENDWYSRKPIIGDFEVFIRQPNTTYIPKENEWKKL